MTFKKKCLLGTLIFCINLIHFFLFENFFDIIIINSIIFAGYIDYKKFIIPDTSVIIILIVSLFNFSIYNLIISIIIFLLLLNFYKKKKMGFGDLKLLTVLSLYFGYEIFFIIIFSIILIIILNFKKEQAKIPFGFYIMFGVLINLFMRWFYDPLQNYWFPF